MSILSQNVKKFPLATSAGREKNRESGKSPANECPPNSRDIQFFFGVQQIVHNLVALHQLDGYDRQKQCQYKVQH